MRPAVFVDFQGTIGGGGTDSIENLTLYPFSARAIGRLNRLGLIVIGITNQSHISKGKLTWALYEESLARIQADLKAQGAYFDEVYCCPHSDEDECSCKKPLTGMVEQACARFSIDPAKSYVIGDMGMSDMVLAKNIGARGILVLTGAGQGSLGEYRHTWQDCEPWAVAGDILEAADKIAAALSFGR